MSARTLQQQAERDVWRMKVLGGASVVVAIAFYLFVFRSSQHELRDTRTLIAAREAELADKRQKVRDLPAITIEVERLRGHVARTKKLLDSTEQPAAHSELMQLGQRLGLEKFRYEPDRDRPMDGFRELPISISFEGDFSKIYSFLRETEHLPRMTRVRKLVLRSRDHADGRISGELTMNVYLSEK